MAEGHLLELDNITKYYGNIIALRDVSTYVNAGEVTCVLGDNGAGKSTFIKILSGVHQQTEGTIHMNGEEVSFNSPRDALAKGIATVYQDLAMVPLMSVWRNFFLGSRADQEPRPVEVDRQGRRAKRIAKAEMAKMGIDIRDHRAAGRHAVRRRAPVGGDRPRRLLRRQGADPRRADVGARRQAVGRRAQAHRRGPEPGSGRDLHHPQPPARVSGRQPIPDPQPRALDGLVRQGRHHRSTSSPD